MINLNIKTTNLLILFGLVIASSLKSETEIWACWENKTFGTSQFHVIKKEDDGKISGFSADLTQAKLSETKTSLFQKKDEKGKTIDVTEPIQITTKEQADAFLAITAKLDPKKINSLSDTTKFKKVIKLEKGKKINALHLSDIAAQATKLSTGAPINPSVPAPVDPSAPVKPIMVSIDLPVKTTKLKPVTYKGQKTFVQKHKGKLIGGSVAGLVALVLIGTAAIITRKPAVAAQKARIAKRNQVANAQKAA